MNQLLQSPAHRGSNSHMGAESSKCIDPQALQSISTIMSLSSDSLVNCNPALPEYPGAVRVLRYRDESPKNSSLSGQVNTAQAESSDTVRPSYAKQRAAWAWERTSQIYDRCANNLVKAGCTAEALNLRHMKDKASVLNNIVETLRTRGKLARRHAERLLSETTARSFVQWTLTGDGLSPEDVQFYQNQLWAYEDVQRAAMSKAYREAATKFFLEAFYNFIDEEIEFEDKAKHLTSNQYLRNAWEDTNPMNGITRIFALWATACQWSIEIGQDGAVVRGDRRRRCFREMMRRAVHHYAHAEWLLQELHGPENTSSSRRKIEPWRLARPSGVDFYINDCMIRTTLSLSMRGENEEIYTTVPEDEYLEWYVCTVVDHSEHRWDMSDGYGAPGAPEFVYETIAARSFPETPLALSLSEPPSRDLLCGTISSSSTTLEKYTAIIGDIIFEEWFAISGAERMVSKPGLSLTEQLTLIRRDVHSVINHQATFMGGTRPSPANVCAVIEGHIRRLAPEILKQENYDCVLWMYHLEWNLRLWVRPWFDIRLNKHHTSTQLGNLSVQLLNARTGQLVAGKLGHLTALDHLRLEHARFLQRVYSNSRRTIAEYWSKPEILPPHYENWALRYRAVIERGNWSGAPLIQGWSLRPFRMQSPISLYKATIQAMHSHPEKNKDWELDLQGLFADLRKVEQEQERLSQPNETIKMVLDQWDSEGLGRTNLNPDIEEFARIRNSKTPHFKNLCAIPLEEYKKYQEEGPKIKRIRAAIFPAGTAPEEFLRTTYSIYRSEPPLIEAVRDNDEEEVRQLLENGAETEILNDYGTTPLQLAVNLQYKKIVRILLQYKANPGVEALVREGERCIPCTVLRDAVAGEDADIVALLLQHGAEVYEGELLDAVHRGKPDILQHLLDHGADIAHRYDNEENRTVLHIAAFFGNSEVVTRLINSGAEIDARDIQSVTPLHLAAIAGHAPIVQLLVDAGADVDGREERQMTALFLAVDKQQRTVVQTLLANHANTEIGDHGCTPLFRASLMGDDLSMRLLLDNGANPNVQYININPLHAVVADGTPEIMELLLRYGADVNAQGSCKHGRCETPLHFAASSGKPAAAAVLLAWRANVNSTCHDGQTPLHLAAREGHAEMVSLLLENGAVADAKDAAGRTPLWQASANGHAAVAKLLQLDRGTTGIEAKDQRAGPWHRSLVQRLTRPRRARVHAGEDGIREASQAVAGQSSSGREAPKAGYNSALQDYQQQLQLLEQQNKARRKVSGQGASRGSTSNR